MASSVVYASIFGAVLASLRSVSLRFVVFDTNVVDLSEPDWPSSRLSARSSYVTHSNYEQLQTASGPTAQEPQQLLQSLPRVTATGEACD